MGWTDFFRLKAVQPTKAVPNEGQAKILAALNGLQEDIDWELGFDGGKPVYCTKQIIAYPSSFTTALNYHLGTKIPNNPADKAIVTIPIDYLSQGDLPEFAGFNAASTLVEPDPQDFENSPVIYTHRHTKPTIGSW